MITRSHQRTSRREDVAEDDPACKVNYLFLLTHATNVPQLLRYSILYYTTLHNHTHTTHGTTHAPPASTITRTPKSHANTAHITTYKHHNTQTPQHTNTTQKVTYITHHTPLLSACIHSEKAVIVSSIAAIYGNRFEALMDCSNHETQNVALRSWNIRKNPAVVTLNRISLETGARQDNGLGPAVEKVLQWTTVVSSKRSP